MVLADKPWGCWEESSHYCGYCKRFLNCMFLSLHQNCKIEMVNGEAKHSNRSCLAIYKCTVVLIVLENCKA